ncbi:MAG: GIY-YIG nuclease family protein [Candidatus Omnitrophica bacterium]|nr:GIY-YIG nuclease family protein [Candidatus Omnitrophota bacterium]
MVQCTKGTYYTGYTNDLAKRQREHNNGKRGAKYLRGKGPVELVYVKEYRYYKQAVDRERFIKKLSHGEKKKLADIYVKTRSE